MQLIMRALLILVIAIPAFAQKKKRRSGDSSELMQIITGNDIRIPLPDLTIDIGNSSRIKADPLIEIFPNRDLVTFSRAEQLRFGLDLRATHSLPGDFKLGAGFTPSIKGEFIRQYDKWGEAANLVKNPPFNLSKLPFTAQRARSNLQYRDYFSMDVRASFSLNASVAKRNGMMELAAGGYYIVSGDFRMEVYKLEGDKVFVRASAIREQRAGIFARARFRPTFEVFKVDLVDDAFTSLIKFDVIDVHPVRWRKGRQFSVSFVYDLKDSKARAAFDQMVNPSQWKLTDLKILTPIGGKANSDKVEKVLLTYLELSEEASHQQASLPDDKATVRRKAKARIDFEDIGSSSDINLVLLADKYQQDYKEQDFGLILGPQKGTFDHYRIASSVNVDGGHFFFANQAEIRREANILFTLHKNRTLRSFEELNFSFERSDWTLRKKERSAVMAQIYRIVPEQYHPIIINKVPPVLNDFVGENFLLDLDVFFGPEALAAISSLTDTQIKQTVVDHIHNLIVSSRSRRSPYGQYDFTKVTSGTGRDAQKLTVSETKLALKDEIAEISTALTEVFSDIPRDAEDYQRVWDDFSNLRRNILFDEIGAGLFTRLLLKASRVKNNQQVFIDNVRMSIVLRGRNRKPETIVFGTYSGGEFFSELLNTRNQLIDRRFDPEYFNVK